MTTNNGPTVIHDFSGFVSKGSWTNKGNINIIGKDTFQRNLNKKGTNTAFLQKMVSQSGQITANILNLFQSQLITGKIQGKSSLSNLQIF